ncbi:MAG TPA: BatA domain-containing protein [Candidatus Acidoferrales bacterium]|nr:BatA domain-containing protein [Candidatus Acidoferrales bacterium]
MGLLNPQNLIYAASLALLVLIYLRSRSRRTIEVSSLMLFDEAPAPVANAQHVRFDPLFWLEMFALASLTLALAGAYIMRPPSSAHGRIHALVFDLGAAMGAREGSATRLDAARRQALDLIAAAPAGDEFSIIGYALEAQVRHTQTANAAELRKTLDLLEAMAVPARDAALRAALMRARGSAQIDLFADRPPAAATLAEVASFAQINFHKIGSGDANVALVSLDTGIPRSTKGRAVIRNFSKRPQAGELAIDLGTDREFGQPFLLAPREQTVVPFGPLTAGGVVHARIRIEDEIEADNSRYAYAPSDRAGHVLVLSPDPAIRDDIARVLLAVDANFQIEAADPGKYHPAAGAPQFDLAVMHDSYLPAVAAPSTLLIFPPQRGQTPLVDGIAVEGTAPHAEIRSDAFAAGAGSMTLGETRIMAFPEWMDSIATAAAAGHRSIPVAAIGRSTTGPIGVIAFDIRNHLLLAPDHLDALITVVGMVKRLTAPRDVQIVSTGTYVSIPAAARARITQPDGSVTEIAADQAGRVRIRPLQAGRYQVQSGGVSTEVLANYFDASESDLSLGAAPTAKAPVERTAAPSTAQAAREVAPLAVVLIALALLALMIESAILVRHATRWGMRHV